MEALMSGQSYTPGAENSSSEELVDRFLDAIWMERGLSANTLGAYRAGAGDAFYDTFSATQA